MKKTKAQIQEMKLPPEPVQEVKAPAPPEPWDSVKEVMAVLQKAMNGEWGWYANTRCKYIDLRIDMRGHSCQIKDREGNPISLQKLQHQLKIK